MDHNSFGHVKLNPRQAACIRDSQQFLVQDATDILFRTYDILFRTYPALRNQLPVDRYTHPNIIGILATNPDDSARGVQALWTLIEALSPTSPEDFSRYLNTIRENLLIAIKDIMFDIASDDLLTIYTEIFNEKIQEDLTTFSRFQNGTFATTENVIAIPAK